MALILLITGLAMNIIGVVMSYSRDLVSLLSAVGQWVAARWKALIRRIKGLLMRLRGKPGEGTVVRVSGSAGSASGASGAAFAWEAVPDDLTPEEAVLRLTSRTDNLREMLAFESERRSGDVRELCTRTDGLRANLDDGLARLDARIDDFDVKPAGQRAVGALLVICGSLLMFTGGLLGA